MYTSRFLWLAMYFSYNKVPLLSLLHIGVALREQWAYPVATRTGATAAAEYPNSTFTAAPTLSSHRGNALYETYVAGQRNLDVVYVCLWK